MKHSTQHLQHWLQITLVQVLVHVSILENLIDYQQKNPFLAPVFFKVSCMETMKLNFYVYDKLSCILIQIVLLLLSYHLFFLQYVRVKWELFARHAAFCYSTCCLTYKHRALVKQWQQQVLCCLQNSCFFQYVLFAVRKECFSGLIKYLLLP